MGAHHIFMSDPDDSLGVNKVMEKLGKLNKILESIKVEVLDNLKI